ncbi:hypothetical protein [Amycolatopsis sp. TNS106]|uniref:hypothetical protein n=1 Tax=Amycolatopsis sp. TNS106 TaxID=2861750 RepID=UPI001C5A226B|nr:hypothetical protein [Amycolatopsis sp. TNS106]QXV57006.1 hypothetical protein CVV72_08290 [Amycolatopsis sp. TNS106]
MIDTDADEVRLCALEGCENPLPPPAVDADGKRKGGRPSAYCSKTHADAASRARRAAAVASVADPLLEVRRISDEFTPAAASLVELLDAMRSRFDNAAEAALGRVTEAETDAAAARREAEDAHQAAAKADTARATALAASRDDKMAKAKAERAAEQALKDAEETRRRSWAEVAAHERARGAAEAATVAAERARDALVSDLRTLREDFAAVREEKTRLAAELGERDTALARAVAELEALLDRLDEAKARATVSEKDCAAARAESAALRGDLDRVRAELAQEHTARSLAEARATALAEELERAQSRAVADQARYDDVVRQLAELARPPVVEESPESPVEAPELK